MPPYLAGRENETGEFRKLLQQDTILQNMILTGLRGVGKTVLVDTFKPIAIDAGWLWVGTELSESSSLTENRLATRIMTDLATVTFNVPLGDFQLPTIGFQQPEKRTVMLDFEVQRQIFEKTPGLAADKLKTLLETVWGRIKNRKSKGIIFAYDEAQNLADRADRDEFPLSLLLDVFQSIQKKGIPFMLALVGLPTLFPKLVEARTFSERMFRIVFLDRLSARASQDAIRKPIQDAGGPVKLKTKSVNTIVDLSRGYPYFIQFICREVYDAFLQQQRRPNLAVPVNTILRKLDSDFFAGRWARASDRQRDLLTVAAHLPNSESEFSIQEVVERSRELARDGRLIDKAFGPSHVNQMFLKLADAGLLYKNRHGKYSFAVPLLDQFIRRHAKRRDTAAQLGFPFVDEDDW